MNTMAVSDRQIAKIANRIAVLSLAVSFFALASTYFDPFGWRQGRLVEPDGSPLTHNEEVPLPPLPIYDDDLQPVDEDAVDNRPNEEQQPTPRYVPFGNNQPTHVSLHNDRQYELIVQRVDFVVRGIKRTPKRKTLTGAADALAVNYKHRHFERPSRFTMLMAKPHPVPGHEWLDLEISIHVRDWRGQTYVGSVILYYNGGKTKEIRGVEIDCQ